MPTNSQTEAIDANPGTIIISEWHDDFDPAKKAA
jgi:hypothetical protein